MHRTCISETEFVPGEESAVEKSPSSASATAGMEALVKAEEERLADRERKKEEKRQKLEEARAKAAALK